MTFSDHTPRKRLLTSAALFVIASLSYAPLSNAVVPNDNSSPEDVVDTDGGVNGVGMFFRNDGFVCTGTLINPRTVLFAAHCVNDRPEEDFGPTIPSAFSFGVDALPGFQNWIANGFASNPDLFVFNINQIFWNPESTARPDSFGFLEGDIALASLDTPAANIPTWALLFSRLPDPLAPGDDGYDPANGTGYHVDITGYGRSGSGSTGASFGIDWRRRAAENMLGSLSSFDDRNNFLFGAAFGDLPQNLYRLDFDDPNKENAFDFDLYQDEPLENEGTTAGGDSGGPLILDAENNNLSDENLVIGVLSGGSRFFGPQVFSSYGTESFFQPLFLYADYIAANNPYRYVSAIEGDGAWEDASHWQSDLDPNYRIIDASGNVVNGFPDTQPAGRLETDDPGFGTVCFDPEGDNPGDGCLNFASGEDTPPSRPAPETNNNNMGQLSADEFNRLGIETNAAVEAVDDTGGALSNAGGVLVGGESQSHRSGGVELVENESHAPGDPLPAPTIENGLAGATDFVPDNIDPPSGNNGARRYFEVTLSNSGTTTLSSTRTIDRLNIGGAAGLIIDANGDLTTLIDVNQTGGRVVIDGVLNSASDYTLFSGMLSGTGTVTAPFLTNIAGMIAPGALGTIGTLTIDGSAVLSSGSSLLIDIGANGINDRLAITGDSSLGGQVFFNPTADVRAGNVYTFLTTAGTQSGELSAANISTILRPVLTHTDNAVFATIEAGTYNDAIASGNNVQSAYAKLLDGSRGVDSLSSIYASLDLTSDDQIQAVLDSWAPVTETTTRSLAKSSIDTMAHFHRNRMSQMGSKSWGGGSVTVMGNPVQMASNADYMSTMSDTGQLQAAIGAGVKTTHTIPDDYAIYLSGSFIDGSGSAMPTAQNYSDEDFDGWSIVAGIEHAVSEKITVGASLSYTELEAEAALNQLAETDHLSGSLYGQLRSSQNLVLDGLLSVGTFGTKNTRTVAFPSNATLTSDDDSLAFTADIQVSRPMQAGSIMVVPKAGLRSSVINFDDIEETGGLPGLDIDRDVYQSTQGRLGLDLITTASSRAQFRLTGDIVREFNGGADSFNAGFVGGGGVNAPFLLFGTDKTWGEIGAGLNFGAGKTTINLSADTTVGRRDIEARTYRAGISVKF
ncbi:autotransporter domain-containing protein [Algimonas arctica]|nr:autotransporter domain-containing protein [Algimonas arctica]